MARVNWNTAVSVAVTRAKTAGREANVAEAKNVVNDLVAYLCERHTYGEILDGVIALHERLMTVGKANP